MPASRKRQERAVETRARLIAAGIQLLEQHGAQVKVADVTEAALTAKGTFYVHFETWEHFLVAIRDHLMSEYVLELEPRLVKLNKQNFWKVFDREVSHLIEWIAARQTIHRLVFHGTHAGTPIAANLSADGFVAGVLRQGQSLGLVRTDLDVELMGPSIFQLLHTAGENASPATLPRLIRQTRVLIKAGIAA